VGAANAHLTDLYKRRGRSGELGKALPGDFDEHLVFFQREVDVLQPKRIVALGNIAYGLLMRFMPDLKDMISLIWHFGYVVRAGRIPEYETHMRNVLAGGHDARTDPHVTRFADCAQQPTQGRRRAVAESHPNCTVTYSHSRLCFKALNIEPLKLDDRFCVITAVGTFVMTKREFYSTFPKVIVSESYTRGAKEYHYRQPPRRSLRFRV
jgi:hypothetical protein